jgi:hypothetical protein
VALSIIEGLFFGRLCEADLTKPGQAPAGEPGRHVQIRQGCLGPQATSAAARPEYGNGRQIPARPRPARLRVRVSRDFARSCQTRMLVMPDDTPAHPYQTSVDIASLVPNAEVTVYPWRDPPELKEPTINRVRIFLEAHQPVTASR